MAKSPISLTLEENNLLWLRGRTAAAGFRSISETLDRLVTEARTSGKLADISVRSVAGTIDIAPSDPLLEGADAMIREHFEASLRQSFAQKKRPDSAPPAARSNAKSRRRG